ncbi:hypothetical protein EMIT051CA3_20918 [Pseudomonas chlororaphis]
MIRLPEAFSPHATAHEAPWSATAMGQLDGAGLAIHTSSSSFICRAAFQGARAALNLESCARADRGL